LINVCRVGVGPHAGEALCEGIGIIFKSGSVFDACLREFLAKMLGEVGRVFFKDFLLVFQKNNDLLIVIEVFTKDLKSLHFRDSLGENPEDIGGKFQAEKPWNRDCGNNEEDEAGSDTVSHRQRCRLESGLPEAIIPLPKSEKRKG